VPKPGIKIQGVTGQPIADERAKPLEEFPTVA